MAAESPTIPPLIGIFAHPSRWILTAVLILAAVNVGARLNREVVTDWDESLYATSAAEAVASGHWIGTTFQGAVDYYNTKPPLNIWLIATSFKAFGIGLGSLRLPSALAAWLTVLTLYLWVRRTFDPAVALLASVVLATSYSFLYLHAARSGNPDAVFAWLVLLTTVMLSSAHERPWRLAWLGPILAASFLLKGMGVLMPAAIVLIVLIWRRGGPGRTWWAPLGVAGLLAIVPVAMWVVARWRFDRERFLALLVGYDFLARMATPLEGHVGGWLYYLNILQKDQYDWIAVAVLAAFAAFPVWRTAASPSATGRGAALTPELIAWVVVTTVVPTLMRTKLAWYLNPFYPAFALGVACIVVGAYRTTSAHPWRRRTIVGLVVAGLLLAEGRLIWYSLRTRDLGRSPQGLLLAEREALRSTTVFRAQWNHADRFVLEHLVGATPAVAGDVVRFMSLSQPGDCLLATSAHRGHHLRVVRSSRRWTLYCRPR